MTIGSIRGSSQSISAPSDLAPTTQERSPAFQGALLAFNPNGTVHRSAPPTFQKTDAAAPSANRRKNTQSQCLGVRGHSSPTEDRVNIAGLQPEQNSASQIAANRASSRAYARPNGPRKDFPLSKPPMQAPIALSSSSVQRSVAEAGVEETVSPGARSLVQLYEAKQTTTPLLNDAQSVRYVNDHSMTSFGKSIQTRPKSHIPPSPLSRTKEKAGQGIDHMSVIGAERLTSPSNDRFAGPKTTALSAEDNNCTKPMAITPCSNISGHEKFQRKRNSISAPIDSGNPSDTKHRGQQQGFRANSGPLAKQDGLGSSLGARSPESLADSSLALRSLHLQYSLKPNPLAEKAKPGHVPIKDPRAASRNMSVDSLANAIVASSLASSRAPSPARTIMPPPPLPRRHHLFYRSHSQEIISRTPSPAKAMRQTMRKPVSSDEELGSQRREKGRSHLVRKHPNKHHEGDRKRWRTQILEKERKRYEGVWAANKGLHMDFSGIDAIPTGRGMVLNIVVREIWRRSRLPDDVLAEIWELVSGKDADSLGREEFVVGMWLIDQRLKGYKLPAEVNESVWGSVRMLEGIKLPYQRIERAS